MKSNKKQSTGRELRRKKTSEVIIGDNKYKIPITVHQVLTQETRIKEILAHGILGWHEMFMKKETPKEEWHATEYHLVELANKLMSELEQMKKEDSIPQP